MYAIRLSHKGSTDFPLVIDYHLQEPTEAHSHDCVELIVILSGNACHGTETGSRRVAVGDVLIIYPGLRHSYSQTEDFELINVLFRPEDLAIPLFDLYKIAGYHQLFGQKPDYWQTHRIYPHFHLPDEVFADVRNLIKILRQESNPSLSSGYRCCMMGCFMALLCLIIRSYSGSREAQEESANPVRRAIRYLGAHFTEPFDLDELVRLAAMSKSNFMRHFQFETGTSPLQYARQLRISLACRLLRQTSGSITEIATSCGFVDGSHFTKIFRRIIGCTPREYRNRPELEFNPRAHLEKV